MYIIVNAISCIISSFYIKPQLMLPWFDLVLGCIISSFYIKPQQAKHQYEELG